MALGHPPGRLLHQKPEIEAEIRLFFEQFLLLMTWLSPNQAKDWYSVLPKKPWIAIKFSSCNCDWLLSGEISWQESVPVQPLGRSAPRFARPSFANPTIPSWVFHPGWWKPRRRHRWFRRKRSPPLQQAKSNSKLFENSKPGLNSPAFFMPPQNSPC